jgi:magnesium transporter
MTITNKTAVHLLKYFIKKIMVGKKYLDYILSPLDLVRTKKVLQVNPTVSPDRSKPIQPKIILYEYDKENSECLSLKSVEDTFTHISSPQNTWINIDGLRKDDVENICMHYGIHQLIAEDILSIGQRPKMDELNGLIFCLLNMLYFNEKNSSVETEQISIVLGKDFVISFQEDETRDVFNPLREKIKIAGSKVRTNGADFLFYTLIDLIVDSYYLVMEKMGDKIELLEEDIVRNSNTRTVARISIMRKEMIVLKRSIAPVRELVNGILRSESELIDEKTEKYFKDVYDHIVQANDLAENYRDMMMNLHDLYLSNVNLKMNEVMKVMAVVTCLMAPATVIGGIFGMNFQRIPLLHNQWGFFISVALMLLIPLAMLRVFRKRGWF